MTPERFQRIDELVTLAQERTASERAQFIREACGDDEDLRVEVESLLACQEEDGFSTQAPSKLAAELLREQVSENTGRASAAYGKNEAQGRYKVLGELGTGGMGVVYAAYDLELGRKVAIKLVRPEASASLSASEGRARLLREARAMAQLSHPNAIAVYDVGTFGEQVFIAMEYVEGSTLSQWLAERKRAWPEVLSIFLQAGRGLAAAHAAGILHRDFKPDNVLVGNNGRVRVLDFGLARATLAATATNSEIADAHTSAQKRLDEQAALLSVALTEPGKLMGTPAFMAPEQLRGQLGDARTDQFSFCIALYQGLYCELPFSGETVATLLQQMEQKGTKQAPESVRVPSRLRKVLLRGLSPAREDRYESMDALLHELTRRPPEIWRRSLGALVLLAALFAIGRSVWPKPNTEQLRSIAVLPLENLSHDPQQDYLADGLTDELITNLSRVGSLRVIARSSAMRYKARPRSIPQIVNELKVDAVLDGTVLASGDQVRVTTALIDASSHKNLWAEKYEGRLADVLFLQNRIARAIIAAVRVKLTSPEEQGLAKVPPVTSDAYQAYLHGIFYWEKSFDRESVDAAIGMFERATTLSPEFALAHARLALAYASRQQNFEPGQELVAKASVAVKTSLSLDPNLAEGYMARGRIASVLQFPLESAIPDFQRALALNAHLGQAHFYLGAVYLQMGFLDEALSELNAVLALDPYSVPARYYIARVHLYQGRYDEALLDFQRSSDFGPTMLWQRVLILLHRGEKSAAHELIGELRRKLPDNEDVASTYAVLLAAEGENEKAEEQIRLAIRTGDGRVHFHYAEYNIASAYALMGNPREALRWLRKTAEGRLTFYPHFERDPNLNNLRADPEFKTWLAEMKSLWERRRSSL